jgi:2-keto-4-pentenoate hydratase/2-oxohepta-3-ene-1,7-dioic acid hydratase in catechol pathway
MRYVRVILDRPEQRECYGVLEGYTIHILRASPLLCSAELTGEKFFLGDVKKFLPPVDPPNIIALGLNYKEHAKESKMELPVAPVIF